MKHFVGCVRTDRMLLSLYNYIRLLRVSCFQSFNDITLGGWFLYRTLFSLILIGCDVELKVSSELDNISEFKILWYIC